MAEMAMPERPITADEAISCRPIWRRRWRRYWRACVPRWTRAMAEMAEMKSASCFRRAARPLGARRSGNVQGAEARGPDMAAGSLPTRWTRLIPSVRMEVAPLRDVTERWGGYLQSIGQTMPQVVDILMQTEQTASARHGAAEAPRRFTSWRTITGCKGCSSELRRKAPLSSTPRSPSSHRPCNRCKPGRPRPPSRNNSAPKHRCGAAVQTFAEEKTEAGVPAHPHFTEVEDDMARLAQADSGYRRTTRVEIALR